MNYDCMYESKWGDTMHVPSHNCINGKEAKQKADDRLIENGYELSDLTFIMATAKRGDH